MRKPLKERKQPSGIMLWLALIIVLPTPAFAVVENITPFEWAMPDRLLVDTGVPNHDPADPIPRYDPNALMIPAGGWTVHFNACGVTTSTIVNYEWFVDSASVANTTNCQYSHQFPEEGSYHIRLIVTDNVGATAILEETITVQDWLIVAMGDSYGSGEGNPQIPVSAQAQIDFSVLYDLAANVRADLDAALAQLPGLEDAQAAAQQLVTDTQATLTQAQQDLAAVQQDLQDLLVIETNVDNDPAVVFARNNVIAAEQWVRDAQIAVNQAQQDYDNCIPIINCPVRWTLLQAAQAELLAAEANLLTAQAALWTARTAAVVIYSAIATIQDFDALQLAIDSATLAVNAAQNTVNTALNAYNNATTALNDAIAAVLSLQSIIDDFQTAWNDARTNARTQYLDHLPTWTVTPPSWGTPEPSYADIVLNNQTMGEALRCHRSMYSGQARAALALELADPHTSVTFVHLSCTGATIYEGLTGMYRGADVAAVLDPLLGNVIGDPENPMHYQCTEEDEGGNTVIVPCKMPSQLEQAETKILGREIDAMVISIGGNDIKFADIIMDCIFGQPCHENLGLPPAQDFTDALVASIEANCNPVTYFNQWSGLSFPSDWFPFSDKCLQAYNVLETNIGDGDAAETFNLYMYGREADPANGVTAVHSLNTRMTDLSNEITRHFSTFDQQRVYITQYPDPTGDEFGNTCEWFPNQGDPHQSLPGVTLDEAEWARTIVAPALRDQTHAAALEHGWHFVTETGDNGQTIATESSNHGYCAAGDGQHWTVRIPESLVIQQDLNGTMHPNRAGHAVYKKAIFHYLMADLYPAGVDQPPRQPVDPTVSNNPGPNGGGGGGGGGSLNWITLLLLTSISVMRRRART